MSNSNQDLITSDSESRKSRSHFLLTLVVAGALFLLFFLLLDTASAELTVTHSDEAPDWVPESSSRICVMSLTMHNNSGGNSSLQSMEIVLKSNNMNPSVGLRPLAANGNSGVSIYEETNGQSGFQNGDVRRGTPGAWVNVSGLAYYVNFTFGAGEANVSSSSPGAPNYYIIIRTSSNLDANDAFNVNINVSGIRSTSGNAPNGWAVGSIMEGDVDAPGMPSNFVFVGDEDSQADGKNPIQYYNDDHVIDIEWDAAVDAGSGSGISHYEIGVTAGGTNGEYAEDANYTVGSDGNYTLFIRAIDNVGHQSDVVQLSNWVVCDTILPSGNLTLYERSNYEYIHIDNETMTLFYTDHVSTFNISALYIWDNYPLAVEFGAAFDQQVYSQQVLNNGTTRDSNVFGIGVSDTDVVVSVSFIDRAGNVFNQNVTCVRDTLAPTITNPQAQDSSQYIYCDGLNIYYGYRMVGNEGFTIDGNSNDSQAGVHKAEFTDNNLGAPQIDFSPATWSGSYTDVDANDIVNGNIIVQIFDNVNNVKTVEFILYRDAQDPLISNGDWSESSPYLYVDMWSDNTDNTIYYSNGMGAPVPGTIDMTFTDDGWLKNATYSDAVGVDSAVDLISGKLDSTTAVYSFDGGDSFSAAITITVRDECGNWRTDSTTFIIVRDNVGPTVDTQAADESSPYLHVIGTTIYYGNGMGGPQGFNVTGTSSDADSGVYKCSFSSSALGSPGDDNTPASWSAHYGDVDSGDAWSGTLTITFEDMVSNQNTCTFTVVWDDVAPTIPGSFQCRPGGVMGTGEYSNSSTIWLTWTSSTDAASGFAEYRAGTNVEVFQNDVHVSGDTEVGQEGLETFWVYAIDNVGNWVGTSDTITIDLINPVVMGVYVDSTSHHYYNSTLGINGGEVWFNSLAGMGGGQVFTFSFVWFDVNEMEISATTAFGSSPTVNSAPWVITFQPEIGAVSDQTTVSFEDLSGRKVSIRIDFLVDNQVPNEPELLVGDDSSQYIYFSTGENILFYSDMMAVQQNVTLGVDNVGDGGSGVANVTFDAALGHSERVDMSVPYEVDYGFDILDDYQGYLNITIFDNVGNQWQVSIEVHKDIDGPLWSDISITEASDFLHLDDDLETLYYSKQMTGNESFQVIFQGLDDAGSGLYGLLYPTFAGPSVFMDASPYGIDYSVNSMQDYPGEITFVMYDQVNNTSNWSLVMILDIEAPQGTVTIFEDSYYLYFNGEEVLYYGDDMVGDELFFITATDVLDGVSGVGGVLFPAAFGVAESNVGLVPYARNYSINGSSELEGVIEIIIYDNTYNYLAFNLTIIRDTLAPSGVLVPKEFSPYIHFVSGTNTLYYSNNMLYGESFSLVVESPQDELSGLYQSVFPGIFNHFENVSDMSEVYSMDYIIQNISTLNGVVAVTLVDNVGNVLEMTLNIMRDTDSPELSSFTVNVNGTGIFYDGNGSIYYNNNFFVGTETFIVSMDNIGDELSGFMWIEYPAMFSTPHNITTAWNRLYELSVSDTTEGIFIFNIIDHVGNVLEVELRVLSDRDEPVLPLLNVIEDGDHIYYDLLAGHLWYSSALVDDENFTVTVSSLGDQSGGCGIWYVIFPEMFGSAGGKITTNGESVQYVYTITPGDDFNSTVAIKVFDRVGNSITAILEVKLDSRIDIDPSKVSVSSDGAEHIFYDQTAEILYYGQLKFDEVFIVEFLEGFLQNEVSGSGFLYILPPEMFTMSQNENRFDYTIAPTDNKEGDIIFTIFDRVNNFAIYTLRVVRDIIAPSGEFIIDDVPAQDFITTQELEYVINYSLTDDASGLKKLFISNDGESWFEVTISAMEGLQKWQADDEALGGNDTIGNHLIYFRLVDWVGNERAYQYNYNYVAPIEVGLFDRLPFIFGIFGFLGPWGFLAVGLVAVGMMSVLSRRRKEHRSGSVAEEIEDVVGVSGSDVEAGVDEAGVDGAGVDEAGIDEVASDGEVAVDDEAAGRKEIEVLLPRRGQGHYGSITLSASRGDDKPDSAPGSEQGQSLIAENGIWDDDNDGEAGDIGSKLDWGDIEGEGEDAENIKDEPALKEDTGEVEETEYFTLDTSGEEEILILDDDIHFEPESEEVGVISITPGMRVENPLEMDQDKSPGVSPIILYLDKSTLCFGCKKIIRKGMEIKKCPNCLKLSHGDCIGEKCLRCGVKFI